MRRWGEGPGLRAVTSLAVAALVVSGCTGDDDDTADDTSTTPPPAVATTARDTTASASTDPPAKTDEPTTSETQRTEASTSTQAPVGTVGVDDVLAEIATSYLETEQRREDLVMSPTLDGLSERLSAIAAPGSQNSMQLEDLIKDLVTKGERVVPNSPDYSDVEIEKVELIGAAPHEEAVVTYCQRNNLVRVDSAGNPLASSGQLSTIRARDHMVLSAAGWVQSDPFELIWDGFGELACPST